MVGAIVAAVLAAAMVGADGPRAVGGGVVIERFAGEPDVVTPTGLAVDARGRVLVIESHTHFRPEGYAGPPADRIRRLEDTDGDGKCDRVTTVFEGTKYTMGIAVAPDGRIHVATRNEVFTLREQADGMLGGKATLARLETKGDYPHNGLSGFAFDRAGAGLFRDRREPG